MTQSLNPSQTSSNITLSGSNLIATKSSAGGTFESSVALKLVTAGKWYWEGVNTVMGAGANSQIGIATASHTVTGAYVGNDTFSIGGAISGVFYNAGGSGTSAFTWTAGQVMAIAWDAGAGKMWWQNMTTLAGWTSTIANGAGDPVAGTNGYSVPFVGTAAGPAVGSTNTAASGDSWTMRFTSASFTGTVPSGYSAADGMGAGGGSHSGQLLMGVGLGVSDLAATAGVYLAHKIGKNESTSRRSLILPRGFRR